MPRIYLYESDLSRPWQGRGRVTAWEQNRNGSETKQRFVMDEEKLIILVQGHECLYNLQHKDYDANLVKDNFWKEITGELHAQDMELSRRT
jgi:hypothetical protein